MKTKQYLLALCVLSVTTFVACKKDKKEPERHEKEVLLTAQTWKLKSLTVPKGEQANTDSSIIKDCSLKALFEFKPNGTYKMTDPDKNCDSTLVPYSLGEWKYITAKDSITFSGTKKMAWKVLSISDTELKATFKDSLAPDKVHFKTITLMK